MQVLDVAVRSNIFVKRHVAFEVEARRKHSLAIINKLLPIESHKLVVLIESIELFTDTSAQVYLCCELARVRS